MNRQRRLVLFTGTVQGVGFRYTVRRVSDGFAVTGYVRNLPNGQVEVLAEGDGDEIDAFIAAIEDRMGYYIRGATQRTSPATDEFDSFDITL